MRKESFKKIIVGFVFLAMFALWTILVRFSDVQPIGPNGSSVGFAAMNGFVHELFGVHMRLYAITDWLGLVPVAFMFGFAVLGLVQLISRRSLKKVDGSIIALGVFYIIVFAAYMFFEKVVVNYRPVLIDGFLEASYPSSTTMLAACVIPTAMFQLKDRVRNDVLKKIILSALAVFTAFMVIGRLISGVHWLSDIIGGLLFSFGLVTLYIAVCDVMKSRKVSL